MRTKQLILTVTAILLCGIGYGQKSLSDDLVAYYSFSGSADDISGNLHHGTVYGASSDQDRFGRENTSYYFDGNDYIDCGEDPIDSVESASFSLWIKPGGNITKKGTHSSSNEYIISSGGQTGASCGYAIRWNNGHLVFQRKTIHTQASTELLGKYESGQWLHLAGVYDQANASFRVYIQGKLMTEIESDSIEQTQLDFRDLHIGKPNNVNNYYFHGNIDDIRLYNRTLTESEVWELYTEVLHPDFEADVTIGFDTLVATFTDQSISENTITSWKWDFNNDGITDLEEQNPTWTFTEPSKHDIELTVSDGTHSRTLRRENMVTVLNLDSGLVAYYPFAGNLKNAADTCYNGTNNGVTPTNSRLGIENEAFLFDGVDNFVFFNPDSAIIQTPQFTISAWAYMAGTGGGASSQNPIFQQRAYHGGTTSAILLAPDNGRDQASFTVRGYGSSANTVLVPKMNYGEWHHYVALVDGDSVKLFIDGKCMGAVEFTTGTNYTEFLNSIGIVKHRYDGTNHGFFNGVIDEVRIYERPLHVKEIEALYQNVLVADFEVNDTSGSMLKPFHFQNNSFSENGITTYQWDFNNDGTIDDTNPNPTFNYNQHGSNDVKLIVSDGSDQGTVHSWHASINTLRKDNFCVPESQVPGAVEVEENWQFTEQTSYYSWNSASRKNYKYVRSPLSDSEVGLEQSSGNAGNNYTSFQMPADFSLSVTGNGNQQPTRQKVLSVNYYGDLNARVGWEFFNDWCFGDDKHYLLKDYPEVSQGIKMYIELAGYSGTASGTTSKKEFTITLNS